MKTKQRKTVIKYRKSSRKYFQIKVITDTQHYLFDFVRQNFCNAFEAFANLLKSFHCKVFVTKSVSSEIAMIRWLSISFTFITKWTSVLCAPPSSDFGSHWSGNSNAPDLDSVRDRSGAGRGGHCTLSISDTRPPLASNPPSSPPASSAPGCPLPPLPSRTTALRTAGEGPKGRRGEGGNRGPSRGHYQPPAPHAASTPASLAPGRGRGATCDKHVTNFATRPAGTRGAARVAGRVLAQLQRWAPRR